MSQEDFLREFRSNFIFCIVFGSVFVLLGALLPLGYIWTNRTLYQPSQHRKRRKTTPGRARPLRRVLLYLQHCAMMLKKEALPMKLQTRRLSLLPMNEGDFSDFRHYLLDGELCRMYGLPAQKDEATVRAIFDTFLRGGMASAVVLRASGRMIGHVLVVPSELPEAFRELAGSDGVTLAFALSPVHQRQGLMAEALAAVLGWVFRVRQADFVHCSRFDFNEPSARLQCRFGFVDLGERIHHYRDGERVLVHSVLRREGWQPEIRIRRMTAADVPVIVAEEAAQGWHPTHEKYEMRLRDMADGKSVALVAEYQGAVAGYINL